MPFESLDEFRAAIDGLDDEVKNDIMDFYSSSVEKEKNLSITARRKANSEAVEAKKAMGQYLDALKNLGYDPDGETPLDDYLDELSSKLSGKQGESSELEKKLRALERKLTMTTNQLAEKEKAESELRDKANKSTLKNALMKELGDKIYGAEFAIDSLITNGAVGLSEDGHPVWIDGEEEVEFKDGVQQFLSTHQEIIKNPQKPGAGSAGRGATTPQWTLDRIKQMSPQEIAKLPEADYKQVKEVLKQQ